MVWYGIVWYGGGSEAGGAALSMPESVVFGFGLGFLVVYFGWLWALP